jgi:hypothetical protein
MKNIKKFLYFCTLNCTCVVSMLPMDSQLSLVNGTVIHSNNSANNNVRNIHCGKTLTDSYAPTNSGFTKKTKPTQQASSSFAKQEKKRNVLLKQKQENTNILLSEIRDIIDTKHLKINPNDHFRPMIGSFWSSYKAYSLTDEQRIEELALIQSYISVENKESFLQKLEQKHYYVRHLLHYAVDTQCQEIRNNIKGSTVDAFFYPSRHNGVKRMVHVRALEKYFSTSQAKQNLKLTLRGDDPNRIRLLDRKHGDGEKNTHAAVLYGNKQFTIDEDSLVVSSDDKYLRAVDLGGNEIIWDMETGKRIELTERGKIQRWHYDFFLGGYYGKRCVDEHHRVLRNTAVLVDTQAIADAATLGIDLDGWKNRAIVLHKPWQKEAELVLAAFDKSESKEELLKLLSSKTLAAIKGFPGENIKEEIQAKIDKL